MASYSDSPDGTRGRRDLTIAVLFILLSFLVLYLPGEAQSQVAAVIRTTVLRPFLLTQEALAGARLRAERAGELQARLDSLATIVAIQAPLVEENRRLHELLNLEERAPNDFLPTSIIRPGTPGSESMFLLDVGSDRGVRVGDPVIMRTGRIGLVGRVQQVRRGSSIGIDWSHPDFRASAMTADGNVFGIVMPVRGLFREQDQLLLDGIPFYETLEPGTLITTSGLGGVYPRGIPIGTVEEVSDDEGSWRKSYWLRPIVERGTVTHALVVVGDGATERIMRLFREGADGDSAGAPGGERP
jgi:rod shape-determining protein MreC